MDQIFLGNEQMTVDDKGRVGIPAKFMSVLRALCPNEAETLGIMLTPERSIKIMPAPYFNRELARWQQLNDQIDEERLVLNMATSMAERVSLDKQNRIKLSPFMMEICEITRDVVIVGNLQYMQLYDVKVLREMMQQKLSQWGSASSHVAKKEEPKPTVQYVIQTGGETAR